MAEIKQDWVQVEAVDEDGFEADPEGWGDCELVDEVALQIERQEAAQLRVAERQKERKDAELIRNLDRPLSDKDHIRYDQFSKTAGEITSVLERLKEFLVSYPPDEEKEPEAYRRHCDAVSRLRRMSESTCQLGQTLQDSYAAGDAPQFRATTEAIQVVLDEHAKELSRVGSPLNVVVTYLENKHRELKILEGGGSVDGDTGMSAPARQKLIQDLRQLPNPHLYSVLPAVCTVEEEKQQPALWNAWKQGGGDDYSRHLAQQLQEEEDRKLARRLQEESRVAPAAPNYSSGTTTSGARWGRSTGSGWTPTRTSRFTSIPNAEVDKNIAVVLKWLKQVATATALFDHFKSEGKEELSYEEMGMVLHTFLMVFRKLRYPHQLYARNVHEWSTSISGILSSLARARTPLHVPVSRAAFSSTLVPYLNQQYAKLLHDMPESARLKAPNVLQTEVDRFSQSDH